LQFEEATMPKRVTVTEVARHAGVSVASVSRVLNGIPARPLTEERVRRAASELGYIPDAGARSLKLGRALQIAFAVDDIANPVYAMMMHGVEAGLVGSGSRLLACSTGHQPADLLDLVEGMSRGYADGLIISPLRRTPALIDELAQAPVPVVVIGDIGDDDRLDRVCTDSRAGVGLAYDHLVESERSLIAFVNGPSDTTPGRSRLMGYEEAASRHGRAALVAEAGDFTVAAGEAVWPRLASMAGDRQVDAVIAANDLVAMGLARAALDAGRTVPDSLAVVGVDDIEMASIFRPSLTSVSLGAYERGRLAAELYLRRMENPTAPAESRFVAPQLVVRQSTLPHNMKGRS
jgi:LacI family transcriptional regulator